MPTRTTTGQQRMPTPQACDITAQHVFEGLVKSVGQKQAETIAMQAKTAQICSEPCDSLARRFGQTGIIPAVAMGSTCSEFGLSVSDAAGGLSVSDASASERPRSPPPPPRTSAARSKAQRVSDVHMLCQPLCQNQPMPAQCLRFPHVSATPLNTRCTFAPCRSAFICLAEGSLARFTPDAVGREQA